MNKKEKELKVQLLVLKTYSENMTGLVESIHKMQNLILYEAYDTNELIQLMQQFPGAILILFAETTESLLNTLKIMKQLFASGFTKKIKTLIFTYFIEEQLNDKLSQLGCNEVVKLPIQQRTLEFKLNLHAKALWEKISENKKTDALGLRTLAGLTEENEHEWDIPNISPEHKNGRWTLTLVGPKDSDGEWKKIADKTPDTHQWQWFSKNKESKESWIFEGKKPEFVDGSWKLISKEPSFYRIEHGKKTSFKVHTHDEKTVTIVKGKSIAKFLDHVEPKEKIVEPPKEEPNTEEILVTSLPPLPIEKPKRQKKKIKLDKLSNMPGGEWKKVGISKDDEEVYRFESGNKGIDKTIYVIGKQPRFSLREQVWVFEGEMTEGLISKLPDNLILKNPKPNTLSNRSLAFTVAYADFVFDAISDMEAVSKFFTLLSSMFTSYSISLFLVKSKPAMEIIISNHPDFGVGKKVTSTSSKILQKVFERKTMQFEYDKYNTRSAIYFPILDSNKIQNIIGIVFITKKSKEMEMPEELLALLNDVSSSIVNNLISIATTD